MRTLHQTTTESPVDRLLKVSGKKREYCRRTAEGDEPISEAISQWRQSPRANLLPPMQTPLSVLEREVRTAMPASRLP
jgi:hypothetical protein